MIYGLPRNAVASLIWKNESRLALADRDFFWCYGIVGSKSLIFDQKKGFIVGEKK
jgi:hypothetical protein